MYDKCISEASKKGHVSCCSLLPTGSLTGSGRSKRRLPQKCAKKVRLHRTFTTHVQWSRTEEHMQCNQMVL